METNHVVTWSQFAWQGSTADTLMPVTTDNVQSEREWRPYSRPQGLTWEWVSGPKSPKSAFISSFFSWLHLIGRRTSPGVGAYSCKSKGVSILLFAFSQGRSSCNQREWSQRQKLENEPKTLRRIQSLGPVLPDATFSFLCSSSRSQKMCLSWVNQLGLSSCQCHLKNLNYYYYVYI